MKSLRHGKNILVSVENITPFWDMDFCKRKGILFEVIRIILILKIKH